VVGVWPPKVPEPTTKDTPPPLVPLQPVRAVEIQKDPVIVGDLNKEVDAKQEKRYDKKLEKELRSWLKEKLPDYSETIMNEEKTFQHILKSGVLLCHLINQIQPNSVKNISMVKNNFRQRENISMYLAACTTLGLPETALFSTIDLYEDRDMATVLAHLQFLRHWVQKDKEHMEAKRKRFGLDGLGF